MQTLYCSKKIFGDVYVCLRLCFRTSIKMVTPKRIFQFIDKKYLKILFLFIKQQQTWQNIARVMSPLKKEEESWQIFLGMTIRHAKKPSKNCGTKTWKKEKAWFNKIIWKPFGKKWVKVNRLQNEEKVGIFVLLHFGSWTDGK